MQHHGCASLAALQQRSVEDIAWYWDAVSRDLGWLWFTPYRQVVDTSRGIQWPRWFVDGRTNMAANCVDKHLTGPRRDAVAVISEAEDGTVRTLTYAELAHEVGRLANALTHLGVGAHDGVGVFLPMWHEAVSTASPMCEALPVEADHPALIIYTSGTTGRPKGTVLTHAGFGMKAAHDWAYLFDVDESSRMFWVTDLGWLMGPLLITGTLLLGGTVLLFEGTPDYPQPDRLWALCARHCVTHLGISPTAVRALMPHGVEWVIKHDLSPLRIIGSTGEPWNPEPYMWLFEHVGNRRAPIINYTGGTEISGGILGCFPNAP